MKKEQEDYDKLVDILFEKHYKRLIEEGKMSCGKIVSIREKFKNL